MGGVVKSVTQPVLEAVGMVPDTSGATAAQEKLIAKQEEAITKQEEKVAAQESKLNQETQKRIISRRGGGLRMLLSQERPDAELGITSKLGG